MSNKMRSDWFMPDALEKQQKEIIAGNIKCDNRVDFVSYNLLKKGQNSNIECHNAVGERARHYAKCLHQVSSKFIFSPLEIADIGCGAGFITNEVSKHYPQAKVTGFDISVDAVEYGNKNFPKITFVSKVISTAMAIDKKFDFIYAREFYPFTRTNDFEFQKDMLKLLMNSLNSQGVLILSVTDLTPGVMDNLEALKVQYMNLRSELEPSRLILKYVKSYKLAQVLTYVAKKILRKNLSYFLIFSPQASFLH